MSLFYNPVLKRELVTSLRKKFSFLVLLIFILSLSFLVALLWPEKTLSRVEASQISLEMFQYFMLGQLALVAMMTPAFSAGSMTMEKETSCIDILLSSPITPLSILIGKYLSSVLFLFILLLCSLPIVSICFLVGGVGTEQVVAGYLLLIFSALFFGMIGLTASTFFSRTHSSLAITYLIEIPLVVSLFSLIIVDHSSVSLNYRTAGFYAFFCILLGILMFIANLQRMYFPFSSVPKSVEEENMEEQIGLVLDREQFPDNLISPMRRKGLMEDYENPVKVKEETTEVFGQGTLMVRLIIQISVILTIFFMFLIYGEKEHLFVFYLIAFSSFIAPAFACNSFTQEKERQTLDLLLVTLLSPRQIILGKLLSGLRVSIVLTSFLAMFLVLGWILNTTNPETNFLGSQLIFYLLILLANIFFCTSLGLFASLVMGTTIRSMILTYGTILVLYLLPILFYKMLELISYIDAEVYTWLFLLSPIGAITITKFPEQFANQIFLTKVFGISSLWITFVGFLSVSFLLLLIMERFFYHFATRLK